MSAFTVEDINVNQPDSTGAMVLEVYGRSAGRFAVYRTATRVMIHFSDDDVEGANQRAALTPISQVRSEVEGLIDEMRDDPSVYLRKKVARNENRLGTALRTALQADLPECIRMLEGAKADMEEDRASDIRTKHLIYAACATLALIFLSRVLASDWFDNVFGRFDNEVKAFYWAAAAVGAVGAFFSIVLSIRARTVPIDLQPWDNVTDAVLRVFVGATSAVILIALLKAKFVALTIGGTNVAQGIHGLVLAAFVGGFAERMVSDFLGTVALKSRESATTPPRGVLPPGANERTLTGEEAKEGVEAPGKVDPKDPAEQEVAEADETAAEPDEHEAETGEGEKQAVG